jgi:hypothetical protein
LTAEVAKSAWRGKAMVVLMDMLYVGLSIGFFALTWALVKLCERV